MNYFVFLTYQGLAVADLCFLGFAVSSIVHLFTNKKQAKEYGGNTHYVELFYETHFENGIINGFLAASVFITVIMTSDRQEGISVLILLLRKSNFLVFIW